jgi:DNA replication licensing factor MCM7
MALLQYKAPVRYAEQQEVFKDFLQNFRTFESASETAATEAIEGLHINGDGTSDEYDFMDDVEEGDDGQGTEDRRRKEPKLKYMQMLQDVVDRLKTNIVIELDDLDTVSFGRPSNPRPHKNSCCSRRL